MSRRAIVTFAAVVLVFSAAGSVAWRLTADGGSAATSDAAPSPGSGAATSPGTGAASLPATGAAASGIWYEDNNMGKAGGAPADFYTKFQNPESWSKARKDIAVYYVRSSVLQAITTTDEFLRKYFIPVLTQSHIALAVDTGAATGVGGTSSAAAGMDQKDAALIARIQRLGGRVDFIGLQSTLSKPLDSHGQSSSPSMTERITNAVGYATVINKEFPDIKFGLIDALPTKGQDYQGPYHELAAAFASARLPLDFIHLDSQYERAQAGVTTSWTKIKEVESYVKDDLHLHFGLIATSRSAGYTSDKAYNDAVLDVPVEYRKVGGDPDEYVIMSWYPHPAATVPESAGPGQYPVMKTVDDFHQILTG